MSCARRPAGARRPAPPAGSSSRPDPQTGRSRARLALLLPVLALLFGALGLFAAAPAQAGHLTLVPVTVTSGSEQLVVSWTAHTSWSANAQQQVRHRVKQPQGAWDTSENFRVSDCVSRQCSFTITGLENGTTYEVQTSAYNLHIHWTSSYEGTPQAQGASQSSNANLSGLTATSSTSASGTFTTLGIGTFGAATTGYTASVANSVTHVKLTPTVAESNATVKVGKAGSLAAVTSGSASTAIALAVGANAIKVEVTAQNGTTKDYTVTVTRAGAGTLAVPTNVCAKAAAAPQTLLAAYRGTAMLSLSASTPAGHQATFFQVKAPADSWPARRIGDDFPASSQASGDPAYPHPCTGGSVVYGLTPGAAYDVRAHLWANNAAEPVAASTPVIRVTMWNVPGKPTGVTASGGGGSVAVTWTAPTATGGTGATITGYKVRWRTAGTGAWGAGVDASGTSHTVSGLSASTTYDVQVRALNGIDPGSAWSDAAQGTTAAGRVPGQIGTVWAALAHQAIDVSWEAPSDGGSPIIGYDVEYRKKLTPPVSWTDAGHVGVPTNHIVGGVTIGIPYEVRVRARNAVGPGPWTVGQGGAAADGDLAVPVVRALPGNAKVILRWGAVPGAARYLVRYKEEGAMTEGTPANNGTALTRTVTGLTNGTTYVFRVQAKHASDMGKDSVWSSELSATPMGGAGAKVYGLSPNKYGTPEGTGVGLNLVLSEAAPPGGVTFTVTPVFNASDPFCANFNHAAVAADVGTVPATATVPEGQTEVRVRVPTIVDDVVEWNECFVVQFTPITAGWAAAEPGDIGATSYTPREGAARVAISTTEGGGGSGKIAFGNNAGSTAAYTFDAAEDGGTLNVPVTVDKLPVEEVTFILDLRGDGGTATQGTDYTISNASVTFGPTTARTQNVSIALTDDTGAESSETIELQIRARGATFESLGDYYVRHAAGSLATITVLDDDSPPGAPTDLKVVPGNKTLALTWTAPVTAPSPPVTGYHVHYTSAPKTGAGALADSAASTSTSVVATGWVSAGHTGTTAAQTISGLTDGTLYRVRVRAVNAKGNGAYAFGSATATPPPGRVVAMRVIADRTDWRGNKSKYGQLRVYWQGTRGGGAHDGFEVQYTTSDTVPNDAAAVADRDAGWVDAGQGRGCCWKSWSQHISGLPPDKQYRVRVRAVHSGRDTAGPWSYDRRSLGAMRLSAERDSRYFPVFEGDPVTLTVDLTHAAPAGGMKMSIAVTGVTGGTATPGADYRLNKAPAPADWTSVNFDIPAGKWRGTATLYILDDGEPEGNETIELRAHQRVRSVVPSSNRLTLTIAANDGHPDDTGMKSLVIQGGGGPGSSGTAGPDGRIALNRSFDEATYSYSADVPNRVESVRVSASTSSPQARLTVNGRAPDAPVALKEGANRIDVKVTSADAQNQRTYTVKVNRAAAEERPAASSDATLSALTGSTSGDGASFGGSLALSPAFAPATGRYTAAVGHGVTHVRLTATATDAGATVTVNGTAGAGGAIALALGDNPVAVTVTAADGTTRTYTVTVAREAPPLTAAFEGVPEEHDGKKGFDLRLRFSEALGSGGKAPTAKSFAVRQGKVKAVERIEAGLWRVRIKPDSWKDVAVTLAGGRSCDTAGAVCAADGRSLSNTVKAKIGGPVRIRVKDGKAREGKDESLDFAVSLNRAASHAVSVDYATADGTATAGEDYTHAEGTLSFAPGETEQTVSVAILDDAVDEGKEHFLLRLSNPQGAYLRNMHREAKGVIRNDDHLQTMWLSRFGRTVAGHVTDAVSGRLEGLSPGAHATLAGQPLDLSRADDGKALAEAMTGLARSFGAPGAPAANDDGPFARHGLGGLDGPASASAAPRSMTGRELLLGSSFHVASRGEGSGPGLAAWGRVAHGSFDGEQAADDGRIRVDGKVLTGTLGADAEWDRLLAGVAISLSEGDGTFDNPGVDSGTVESTLTTVSPYLRLKLTERVSAWGLAGWGTGDMTIVQDARTDPERARKVTKTDIEMRLGAVGARGALLTPDEAGGMDLALKADAFFVRTEWEKVSGETDTAADASRVRLVLEGGRAFALGDGATLRPSLELGVRHDGGDAETGAGVEVGGGIAYADPATGLSVEAKARMLVAHADSDYEEWGASASARLDPGERGRGLSFSLAPTIGSASSASERLWGARDARGLAPEGAGFEASRGLDAELGYGLALFGDRFTGTPNVRFGLSDGGARDYTLGWRLTSAVRGDPGFEVSLDATRREAANDNAAEHGVMLRSLIRW